MLRSVTIRVTRRDCYEGAVDPSGCVTAMAGRALDRGAVPPRGSRAISSKRSGCTAMRRDRAARCSDTFELIAATGEGEADVEESTEQ